MDTSIFNDKFFNITGDILELRLIDTYEGEDGALPFYWWDIILKSSDVAIGKISFRIGQNYHSYYNGNIGYEIDEEYRGNHYALTACRMVLKLAEYYHMDKLYLTCDYDNVASYKTMEMLGAKLIEEVCPPKDYIYYYEGMPRKRIYELNLTMDLYCIRGITEKDYDFIYQVKKEAYQKYVEQYFGGWKEEQQKEYFRMFIETYKEGAYIITSDGNDIGFYNEVVFEDKYEIGNICIVPEYQNKGIGTAILKGLLEKNVDKKVTLQYFKSNPVGRLYERLGFKVVGKTEYHYQMVKDK